MKLATALIFLWQFASNNGKERMYFPNEEDALRYKRFMFVDENGITQIQDLSMFGSLQEVSYRWPETVGNVILHLYTMKNKEHSERLRLKSFDDLQKSKKYDAVKSNYFVVHGYINDFNSEICQMIKNSVLSKHDVNVFVVDWSVHTNSLYVFARLYSTKVGQELGIYINKMKEFFGLQYDMFMLVGFSLGAHVAGAAGAVTKGQIKYIVGLDPAGILFSLSDLDERLDESDAQIVHVLHTSILGFQSALGHADFYFNNAIEQPNCDFDVVGSCAHGRAYKYYAESVASNGFKSDFCQSSDKGINTTTIMGGFHLDQNASGDYCLTTNGATPYRISDN